MGINEFLYTKLYINYMKKIVYPVYIEIEERNPEDVYNAVRGEDTYLLESSDGGEKIARYSFIGFNPVLKLTVKDSDIDVRINDPGLRDLKIEGNNPLEIMRNLILQFKLNSKSIARFFGGFVGYFSYDLIRYYIDLNGGARDDLKHPDCEFVLCKNNVIFDHKYGRTYLVSHEFCDGDDEVDGEAVLNELYEISERISNSNSNFSVCGRNCIDFSSNLTRNEFQRCVRVAKDYIYSGDIFQVVLSQRLDTDFQGDEFLVYRRLKEINPSPYMYFLDLGKRKIVGSSPEMLLRVENGIIETYPIAGTRPRGNNDEEDKRLEEELINDEKERAEHVMLVDLGRNDLGKVSEFGSVRVRRFMKIEKFSHVQHIVSEITGKLKNGSDEFSALEATFPAGTVSGAPKVRAMEIIDELEPTRRGIYAGCVGYFSFTRNIDTAITIRTIDFEKKMAHIQVGAGIVSDSKPEREYEETMNKGRAMLKALEVAE